MSEAYSSGVGILEEKTERTLVIQGIRTHIIEAGPPTATPLLYLHGAFMGNQWLDVHTLLARRFRLIAPDIPGFGLTERPAWMRDINDYVLFFRDLLDTLNVKQPVLAGHALGGWIAAELAVYYPERLQALILSHAMGLRVKGSPIADIFALSPQEYLRLITHGDPTSLPFWPEEFDVEYQLLQYHERTTLAALAWNPGYDPRLAQRLARIQLPTLILWGENDLLIPPIYGETFRNLIAGSELVQLPVAGHLSLIENAEEWWGAVETFLNKQDRSAQ